MVIKSQTGMQGVYLVAAELTHLGFIVSVTSRSTRGADLLVYRSGMSKSFLRPGKDEPSVIKLLAVEQTRQDSEVPHPHLRVRQPQR